MAVFSITSEGVEVALTAATAKTVLALYGSSAVRGKIIQIGITFDGTSGSAEPVVVWLVRTTLDDGTRTTTTTEKVWDTLSTPNCIGRHNYAVEPTKESTPVLAWEVHPQGGEEQQWPIARELFIPTDATKGIAIVCTAPAAVNCLPYIIWEE